MRQGLVDAKLDQLPDDVAELKSIIAKKDEEIESLKEKNILLTLSRFGRKSEKRSHGDEAQELLFDETEANLDSSVEPEPLVEKPERKSQDSCKRNKKNNTGRKPIPPHLPRVVIKCELTPDKRICNCGAEMVKCGESISEKVDIIPPKFQVLQYIRDKYTCKACHGVESEKGVLTAPMFHFFKKSIISVRLASWLFVAKFCDALPFYRQEQMTKRNGLVINRATMCLLK